MMETKQCAYCKAIRLETLMLFKMDGLFYCNRGHYREHIREKPIEQPQMDLFQKASEQPKPTPSTSMLSCDVHKTFQYQCRNCNPR